MELKKISATLITTLALAASSGAFAQDSDVAETRAILPENTQPSALMPNLAVNFQLNSTLGEKETEYYARIVEKILKSLPKKLVLEGEEKHLLSGSNKFDTLKVVAYLPAQGEEKSDDPFNKIAKTYNIQFELPREKKLKRLVKAGDEPPTIVEVQEDLDDFLNRVDGAVSVEEKTTRTDSSEGETKQLEAVSTANVVEKNEAKQQELKSEKQNALPKKVEKPKVLKRDLYLNYYDNEIAFGLSQMDEFKKFAKSVKSENVLNIQLISQTAPSPFSSWQEIQSDRVNYIRQLLKEEGVNVDSIDFSLIKTKSTFKQGISIRF